MIGQCSLGYPLGDHLSTAECYYSLNVRYGRMEEEELTD